MAVREGMVGDGPGGDGECHDFAGLMGLNVCLVAIVL